MLVPLLWLADYIEDLDVDVQALAARLTDAGLEVEKIDDIGANWGDSIVVGQVESIDPHPNADRLTLPTVAYGPGHITVVTGADNFAVGDRVPLALVGAMLYNVYKEGSPLEKLKPIKLRGVQSEGMICSEAELGLGQGHDGILVLPADAPVGTPLSQYLGRAVIELDLKPDRADCLAMLGVARYVAGLLKKTFRPPDTGRRQGVLKPPDLQVTIEDSSDCARYSVGYLRDVKIGPSPQWMVDRLQAAGQRSINNIVDITNFVMLEYGQPLHAFDWNRLAGDSIGVRRARAGEQLVTLDNNERSLSTQDLVIVDADGPVGLAGVMGGLTTEVTDQTSEILLEAANFAQSRIRSTARRLGLPSEAARRFEQRLSPEATIAALRRAAQLAEALGAGRGEDVWADAYPVPRAVNEFVFDTTQIPRLLGVDYPRSEVIAALQRAGFTVTESGAQLSVAVPHDRGDVTASADLVEEVVAMMGFDTIPSTLPNGGLPDLVPLEYDDRRDQARSILARAGYQEAITYTLTSPEQLARLYADSGAAIDELGTAAADLLMPRQIEPLAVRNPLRSEESVLKTATLPHLLTALSANLRYSEADVALFELGTIYVPRAESLPDERALVTAVLSERSSLPAWRGTRPNSFYDLKGACDLLLARLGVGGRYQPCQHPTFADGRCAAVLCGDQVIGLVGQIAPMVLGQFGINEATFALIINLDHVIAAGGGPHQFVTLPRFPAVRRDISIVIDPQHAAGDVTELIERAGGRLLAGVRLTDEYTGDQVPDGKRGLSYALSYRDPGRTLTEKAIERPHRGVIKALRAKFGATLRV